MKKVLLIACLLIVGGNLSSKAQPAVGAHILSNIRSVKSEQVRLRNVPDGTYMVFTAKSCLSCFKQLEDSLKSITGNPSFAVIIMMEEHPLQIRNNISLLARAGIKPTSYFVYYTDLDGDKALRKLLEHEPSPWLIQKKKIGVQLRTYTSLRSLLVDE